MVYPFIKFSSYLELIKATSNFLSKYFTGKTGNLDAPYTTGYACQD